LEKTTKKEDINLGEDFTSESFFLCQSIFRKLFVKFADNIYKYLLLSANLQAKKYETNNGNGNYLEEK